MMKKHLIAGMMLLTASLLTGGEMKDIVAIEAPLAPLFKSHRSDNFTVVLAPWQDKLTVQCAMEENTTLFADGVAVEGDKLVLNPPPGITDHVLKAGQNGKPYSIRIKRYLPTPGWQLVNPKAPFAPRDSAGELYFNNKLWILGGYIPKVIPDIWCSSDGGVTWEQKPDLPNPTGINIPVQYVYDNAMWIFGEGNPQKLFRSEDGETWTVVNEAPPMGRRYAASGTVFNGYMWYAGGGKNDVWRSKDGKEWECVTEHAEWSPRQMFGGFVTHNGYLWVLGGGKTTYHPFTATSDIWRSKDGIHWECVNEATPWEGRIWYSGAVFKNRLWLIGGYQCEPYQRNMTDAWYSYDGITWHEFKSEPEFRKRYDVPEQPDPQPEVLLNPHWSSRHETSVIATENKLYVIAGNNWPLRNDVWSLEIPGLCFVTSPPLDLFSGMRYYYAAHADFHADGSPLQYSYQGPDFLTINPATGVLRGNAGAPGRYPITITAKAANGETATQAYEIVVQ